MQYKIKMKEKHTIIYIKINHDYVLDIKYLLLIPVAK